MRFAVGTIYSIIVSAILIMVIDRLTVSQNSLGTGFFIATIYVPPIVFISCLLGEGCIYLFKKVSIDNVAFMFTFFLVLGFSSGILVLKLFFYQSDNLTIPLVATVASISFYVGRNFFLTK
ncbi:hypothetical protein [Paenibacillus sp. KN14-4R]|uniref:hypothetical protein n=1 Tax=Paenibacillus sp. KN14-4R TaxID=3445773 RepID=UPI003F9EFAA7